MTPLEWKFRGGGGGGLIMEEPSVGAGVYGYFLESHNTNCTHSIFRTIEACVGF